MAMRPVFLYKILFKRMAMRPYRIAEFYICYWHNFIQQVLQHR